MRYLVYFDEWESQVLESNVIFLFDRWQVDKMEDCSANCGRGFIRRKITCIKQSSEGIQKLEENECTTPKPSNIEACNGKCSPTQWRFTDWSNVSLMVIVEVLAMV